MDEVTLQKLAASIYEMLPHKGADALVALAYVKWLVETKWGVMAGGGEVVPLESPLKLVGKAVEQLDHRSA